MTKREILTALINHYDNGNKSQFARRLGITAQGISTWLTRNTFDIEAVYSKCENISADWLLTGEGNMLKEQHEDSTVTTPVTKHISTNKSTETSLEIFTDGTKKTPGAIPLVSEKAVGGFASEDFSIKERDILAYYIIPKFRHLGVDFMIEVIGDSMIPKFYPGDIIACSIIHQSRFIQWNKPHLIATREQGLIVKRLRESTDKTCLLAVSDNKEYAPFDIPKDEITGMARIVGVIHLE